MECMTEHIAAIGLILDIIGAIIIFKYGIPRNLNPHGHTFKVMEQVNQEEIDKFRKYKSRGDFGLLLLIIGFVLQLIGQLI